ncbi:MAG: hypothetical protein ACJ0KA_05495 [Verrucomicrobiales bacterium]
MHERSMIMHGYGLFAEKDPYQGWMHGHGPFPDKDAYWDDGWIWTFRR